MALEKAITQTSGYDATYWRIVTLNLSWLNQRGRIVVAGYKDRDTRINKPKNGIMETVPLVIDQAMFQTYFEAQTVGDSSSDTLEQTGLSRETAYALVKQELGQFVDAVDYLEAEASFETAATDLTIDVTDASTSRDGTVEKWVFDFGDGNTKTVDATAAEYADGDEDVSHTYASEGTYTVSLSVTDTEGYTHSIEKEVTVSAPA